MNTLDARDSPLDPELVEERRKTEDMVRQIREKLDQMNAKSSGMVNQFDSEGMYHCDSLFYTT